ncbi:MAG: HPr family phosphocarrier protein [Oscillospiraceae bacterium]|jgi:phosphocarrier protein|nr:HPr family phosphocarrier protein [Oscillospiraceae bacterium]MDD3262033.1 HPr family phosphocarrier protein [Oscillospiraceae bacterium]
MTEFTYTITKSDGLHARPAGLLVQCAVAFPCTVTLKKHELQADAKSFFKLLRLGVQRGEKVAVCCSGEQEQEAAKVLQTFFRENL